MLKLDDLVILGINVLLSPHRRAGLLPQCHQHRVVPHCEGDEESQ